MNTRDYRKTKHEYSIEIASLNGQIEKKNVAIAGLEFDNALLVTDIERLKAIDNSGATIEVKYESLKKEFLIAVEKISVQTKIIKEKTALIELINKKLSAETTLRIAAEKKYNDTLADLKESIQNTRDCLKKKTSRISVGPQIGLTMVNGEIVGKISFGVSWDMKGFIKNLFGGKKKDA